MENGRVAVYVRNLIHIQLALGCNTVTANKTYNRIQRDGLLNLQMDEIIEKLGRFADKRLSLLKKEAVDSVIKDCFENKINIITVADREYPDRLRSIVYPPLVLYFKGTFYDFDSEPAVCIVGPRKVSRYGEKSAYALGYRFAKAGMIVVSGAALGGDTAAHKGALKSGGRTVAVLGCGLLCEYLRKNKTLREKIAKCGCLMSEFPPRYEASKYSFPIRNRILSGLCLCTCVVEGNERSGGIITAKSSIEQGRDVFVIPGCPSLERYKGTNKLLLEGAYPLLDARDVFNMYYSDFSDKINVKKAYEKTPERQKDIKIQKKSVLSLSKTGKIVYNYLDKQKFTADDLMGIGISDDELLSALTELEMEKLIRALPGGIYEII